MNRYLYFILMLVLFARNTLSLEITRIDPPNWWIGMNLNEIQLMIYGNGLTDLAVRFADDRLKIKAIEYTDTGQYVFIEIEIPADLPPGNYLLELKSQLTTRQVIFPISAREKSAGRYQGFDSRDIIYLITPDRFVNGDRANDQVDGMRDDLRPDDILGRHGGDLQGIIDKLDYLKELGVSVLWINPLVENDMDISYHGFGVTDHYLIDPRFGSNDLYRKLVYAAHKKGLKVIMDHVTNHIGIYHPWMKNLPFADWINGTAERYQIARHDKEVLLDIHSAADAVENMKNGWFVAEMPDLNQRNPFVARYLIQNTIWWIEMSGIDGIREDTYPYVDQSFLNKWAEAVFREYPDFNIVGEVWIHDPVFLAPFQAKANLSGSVQTNLPAVTDFGLFEAFGRVFNQDLSINAFYRFISRDYLYSDVNNLLIFTDNHDVMRLMDLVNGDVNRCILALKILLTMRGIPQIFYGTEIGLRGGRDHGEIRADFPGGFAADQRNAFVASGRTNGENKIYNHLRKLIALRKKYQVLADGALIHFPVKDEFYVYFRSDAEETILIAVNNRNEARKLDLNRFSNYLVGADRLQNLMTGREIDLLNDFNIEIDGFDAGIFLVIQQ